MTRNALPLVLLAALATPTHSLAQAPSPGAAPVARFVPEDHRPPLLHIH